MMANRKGLFLPPIVALLLVSCVTLPKSARGPVFTPAKVPNGKAVVYFFRPKRLAMSATTLFMSIPTEADNCYAMVNNGYYAHLMAPGTLNVFAIAAGNRKTFSLKVLSGETHYVKTAFGSWGPTPEFQELEETAALRQLNRTRQISACR